MPSALEKEEFSLAQESVTSVLSFFLTLLPATFFELKASGCVDFILHKACGNHYSCNMIHLLSQKGTHTHTPSRTHNLDPLSGFKSFLLKSMDLSVSGNQENGPFVPRLP